MNLRIYRKAISDPYAIAYNRFYDFKYNSVSYRSFQLYASNLIGLLYDMKDPSTTGVAAYGDSYNSYSIIN